MATARGLSFPSPLSAVKSAGFVYLGMAFLLTLFWGVDIVTVAVGKSLGVQYTDTGSVFDMFNPRDQIAMLGAGKLGAGPLGQ
jgi:hypothetical protein